MKNPTRILLACLVAATLVTSPSRAQAAEKSSKPAPIAAPDFKALSKVIGKKAAVTGVVQSTSKGSKDGIRMLNFGNQPGLGFVAAIFPPAYKKVGPLKNYEGKTVRVTGTVEKYKKQTQIKVTNGRQVKILATPAAKPEQAKKN